MKIAVATAAGIEAVTKRELNKIGIADAPAINGRIVFDGDLHDIARCNGYLTTASRVYILLASFKARNFDELFDGAESIEWEKFISERGRILIDVKLYESKLHAVSATRAIVKKAMVKRLQKFYKTERLSETDERYRIEVSIFKDYAQICLDTSGESLHRRGYRTMVGEAQLKETVAAALIDLSVWKPDRPFADLFCGTGTIAIECALKAKKVAPILMRSFDFCEHKYFDGKVFEAVKREAAAQVVENPATPIFASDIDENQLRLCTRHAKAAGVFDMIKIQKADVGEFSSTLKRGIVISNPPYGERLSERDDIEKLYKKLGGVAVANPDWCFYTLTNVTDFERLFGRRADKKRKIFNGRIECCYYSHLAMLI